MRDYLLIFYSGTMLFELLFRVFTLLAALGCDLDLVLDGGGFKVHFGICVMSSQSSPVVGCTCIPLYYGLNKKICIVLTTKLTVLEGVVKGRSRLQWITGVLESDDRNLLANWFKLVFALSPLLNCKVIDSTPLSVVYDRILNYLSTRGINLRPIFKLELFGVGELEIILSKHKLP